MPEIKTHHTVMLIHGAWAGSWVWHKLAPRLRSNGFDVKAIDLPGNGINPAPPIAVSQAVYVDYICSYVEAAEGKVSLIAHSGAGVLATEVAERLTQRIACVIYVAGMMLPSGMGFAQLSAELTKTDSAAAGISPRLKWTADGTASVVPPRAAREIFLQDVPLREAMAAARRFTEQPESGRALIPIWTAERFGTLPRLYVEAVNDRSVVIAAQRRMQQLVPGAEVATLNCGHVPQISATQELAAAVLPFINQHALAADADHVQ